MYELWPKTSENLAFCAVAPPLGRFGDSLYLSSEQDYYLLTEFQLSSPYGWAARCVLRRNNNNNNNNNNNKNPNKYNRVSALRARTPNNKNPYKYNRVSALRARTPNNKNPNKYNRVSALRARTPNKNPYKYNRGFSTTCSNP